MPGLGIALGCCHGEGGRSLHVYSVCDHVFCFVVCTAAAVVIDIYVQQYVGGLEYHPPQACARRHRKAESQRAQQLTVSAVTLLYAELS